MKIRYKKNNKAVSESVGFVLIIAVVLFSISIIFFGGLPILDLIQTQNDIDNVKQNIDLFHKDQTKLLENYKQSSSHTLKTQQSSISLSNNNTQIKINNEEYNGSIKYDSGRSSLEYEFNALIESSEDFSVMINDPKWTITNENIFITIPNYNIQEDKTVYGRSTNIIKTEVTNRQVTEKEGEDIEIIIETENEAAWTSYFASLDNLESVNHFEGHSSPKIIINNYETAYIQVVDIDIELESIN